MHFLIISLSQPLYCEGQIETWLSSFLTQLRGTLQAQLVTALGYKKSAKPKTRTIHSAGARKVSVPVQEGEGEGENMTF